MAFISRNLFWGIFAMSVLAGCSGEKASSEETASKESVDVQARPSETDEDGEWRLVSFRDGYETKVYGKNNVDYVLSLSDEDKSFDFYVNNDTVEGEYKIVNGKIRFFSIEEREVDDKMLKILCETDCYASQKNDSIIVTLPDDREAIFTRIKG